MTLILGLTGGIASGKSTVSRFFQSLTIPVIDADIVAREVMKPGSDTLKKVSETFGVSVIKEDGTLNRKKLGSIVFHDSKKLSDLNQIVHGAVYQLMEKEKQSLIDAGHDLIVMDIPLLFETGYDQRVDEVMLVYVDQATQIKRLMTRDQLSVPEAEARIRSQWAMEDKVAKADTIIDNTGTIEKTKEQVHEWIIQKGFSAPDIPMV
ncbi:dephospho-CoA kinase [Alkalibacterium sp. MB6]|uniref:dephospho-CoA kinase n=1 Tax=Alkalibacterium sp. MB6 TaxID=2081965 RepID=UPI00137ABFC3|nr:dephospho-CoA kinase [Alkalibacterium sp. MB6]